MSAWPCVDLTGGLQTLCILVVMKVRQQNLYSQILVALTAASPDGATLREIATALETYDSSVRQALLRLVGDGLVARADARYSRTTSPRSALEIERARYTIVPEDLIRIATRMSPAVQLAAFDPQRRTLHVILDPAADPAAVVRLRQALARAADVAVREYPVEMTMGTTIEDVERRRVLREALSRARVLKGDIVRTLPVREPRDPRRAKPLGRLHPDLDVPSRRTKQRLARTYGLDEISLFGSATRRDFGPDSDVDALVHFKAGAVPTLGSYGALGQDLSELLGRNVDVLDVSNVDKAFIPTIERDRVTVYGKPHALVSREGEGVRDPGDRRPRSARRRVGSGPGDARGSNASRRGSS